MTDPATSPADRHDAVDALPTPPPGTAWRGHLTSSHPALAGLAWPFTVVRGAEDGPRLALLSGVHPTEYPAIEACVRVARSLDPATLRGTVVALPLVNVPSFLTRTPFVSPLDGLNPNRVFPGDPDGSVTRVLADVVFRAVIAPSDALLDLHGGDTYEDLVPFAVWDASGDPAVDRRAEAMARALGLPWVSGPPADAGTAASLSGTTTAAAARAGIPAALAEAGGCGLLTEPEVGLLVEGVRRVLRHLGMLPGGEPEPRPTTDVGYDVVPSPAEGLWAPSVRPGEMVAAGQPVGAVRDLFGDHVADVVAPSGGVVLYVTSSPAMRAGGIALTVGTIPA